MPQVKTDKRSRLIQTAVKVACQLACTRTTKVSPISRKQLKSRWVTLATTIKTKDEIGEAIVEQRLLELMTLAGTVEPEGLPRKNASSLYRKYV